jgi:hypothetical protein
VAALRSGRHLKNNRKARQIAWENEQSSRYASTVAICASILLRCGDDIGGSSPKLTCAVADSVHLARVILKRVLGQ